MLVERARAALRREEELLQFLERLALERALGPLSGAPRALPAGGWNGAFLHGLAELDALARAVRVRDVELLTGAWPRVQLFTGEAGAATLQVELPRTTARELGLSGANLATVGEAAASLDLLDAALASVRSYRLRFLAAEQELLEPPQPGLPELLDSLVRMRAKAIGAANGTLNTSERAAFDVLFQVDRARIEKVAELTRSGTFALLEGGDVLLATPSAKALHFELPDLPDLSGATLQTITNAASALARVDDVLQFVQEERARVAVTREQLERDRLHVVPR